jgi:sugar phosphate isomerase/epimerase
MWEIIPDDDFGLILDPSHLILQMIDYERVIREFSSKIFHVHAKDLHIEHEDRVFEGDEELVKRGFYLSRDILKPFIH